MKYVPQILGSMKRSISILVKNSKVIFAFSDVKINSKSGAGYAGCAVSRLNVS